MRFKGSKLRAIVFTLLVCFKPIRRYREGTDTLLLLYINVVDAVLEGRVIL